MAKDKISMPMSGGGLMRYFDDYKSKIEFSPGTVIIMILVVIIIMIILHTYGPAFINTSIAGV